MEKQYYIQVIAENYLKNVMDFPLRLRTHAKFLYGTEPEVFEEGFTALLSVMRNLYRAVEQKPAEFGMMLKENLEYDSKSPAYTGSNNSFLRVPHLLLLFGALGTLQPDLSLALDGEALLTDAKTLKITGLPLLLNKLQEYGFVISGYVKTVKPGDTVTVAFPDTRALTVALKAMADALLELNGGDLKKSKNYFYMMHAGILENEKVKAPKLTVKEIYHALDPEKRPLAAALHDCVQQDTKLSIRMGGFMRNDWSCIFTGKKSKRVLMTLHINQEVLSAKLNLQNIGTYIPIVKNQSERIQQAVLTSGWDCGRCNSGCSGPYSFEMDGTSYNKCRCGSFFFENISSEDVPGFQELITEELSHA